MADHPQKLIQTKLFEILNGDSDLTNLIQGVFDNVPDNQTFPYVTVGEISMSHMGGFSFDGFDGDYTIHTSSATGRSSRGMPYLRTLAVSSDRIRQTIAAADGSVVDSKFADRLALKRFVTGCGWIAEYPDVKERTVMWEYWCRYFREHLLPTLESCRFLAAWYKIMIALWDAPTVYRLTRFVSRITAPIFYIDKIEARIACLLCNFRSTL